MDSNNTKVSTVDFADGMRQKAALAEQARAKRKRQKVQAITDAHASLLQVVEEVKVSRDRHRLKAAMEAAVEAGVQDATPGILLSNQLVQEIIQEAAEEADLADQRASTHALNNRERSQITAVYNAFKLKNTGSVPGFHLKALFLALGLKIRTRVIRVMLKKLKKTGTDPVTLEDFVFLSARMMRGREWTNEISGKFDIMAQPEFSRGKASEAKYITFRDLKMLNEEMKREQPDGELEQMMEIADANNDNRIDEGEFFSLLQTRKHLGEMLQADNRRNYEELKAVRVGKAHRMLSAVFKETKASMDRLKLTEALRKAFEAGMADENDLIVQVKQYISDLKQIEKY